MQIKQAPIRVGPKLPTPWGELEWVCAKVHNLWYVRRRKAQAVRVYLPRLEDVLSRIPENDMAILRSEGLALLHELKGDRAGAIKHRRREIFLMEKLQDDVNAGDYDEKTKASILIGRDKHALQQRRAILGSLKTRSSP